MRSDTGNAILFDLADAPNFAARLAEAHVDPSAFRTLPRLSMTEEAISDIFRHAEFPLRSSSFIEPRAGLESM